MTCRFYLPIFCIGLSFLASCGASSPGEADSEGESIATRDFIDEVIAIDTASAQFGTFRKELISNGKLQAWKESQLRFKLEGEITKVFVRNGQRVAQGDTLAMLYPFTQENKLVQAQRTLEKAELDMQDALLSFGYQWEERDSVEIPENILRMARAKSGYDQALTDLEVAEHEYHLVWLTAPYDGVIANLEAKPYNMTSDYDPFCHLINDSRFEVEFSVLEAEIQALSKGQPVSISPFALPHVSYTGNVRYINPLVDEHGMIKVQAVVNNRDKALLSEMNVKVMLQNEVPQQLIVPKPAVVLRQGREVIFTYQNDTAYWNYVQIGLENSTQYTIQEGLERDATVITAGNLNLAHKVRVAVE